MKLNDVIEIFIGEYDSPATQRTYRDCVGRFVEWIGNRAPSEIEKVDLVRYFQHLKPTMAEATLEKHKKSLRRFFNWMCGMDFIEGANPMSVVKQQRIVKKVRKDKAMTDEELAKLLDLVKWYPRNYAMVLFLAQTGCRAGGISNLRIDNLDLENCMAEVFEKGDRTRKVAFNADVVAALRQWLIKRPRTDNDYVFVTDSGKKMSPANIGQTIRRACLKAGLRSLGPHSLRHRMGHLLAEAKVPPPVAASYLGHSSFKTTMENYYPRDWENSSDLIRELIQTPSGKQTQETIVSIHRKSGTQ